MSEESSCSFQAPWIPPINANTTEGQSNRNQEEESRFVGNEDVSGLEQSSFGDLLALANTASSVYFSGQARWANNVSAGIQRNGVYGEMLPRGNEAVSDKNPKRKKHRPKIVYEASSRAGL